MRKVLPEIDYKSVTKTVRFKKAEVVFLKYIKSQKIINEIVEIREDHGISPFGFTSIEEFKKWRYFFPNQSDLTGVYAAIKKLLKKQQLPPHFNLAMLDYILFGFRQSLFFDETERKRFLCVLSEDVQIPLKEYVGSRSFRSIIVLDGATEKDIIKSIRGRFRTKVDSRNNGPSKHNRDVMLRYYKGKTIDELKLLLEEFNVNHSGKRTKSNLVKILAKKRHDTTVSEDTVNKTRLEA